MSDREAIVAIEELADALYASGTQIEQEASKEQVWQTGYEILGFTAKQLAETTKEYVIIVKGVPSPDRIIDLKGAVTTLEALKVVFSDIQTWIRAQWGAQATNQQALVIQKLADFQHSIHLALDELALAFTPKQKQSALGLDSIDEILRRLKVDLDAKLAALIEFRSKSDEPYTPEQDRARWLDLAIEQHRVRFIPYDDIKITGVVAKGGFAAIYAASWDENDVVLKQPFEQEDFINEVKLHIRIHDCDCIVKFHGVTKGADGKLGLIMKYAHNGNLRKYLQNHGQSMSWYEKLRLAQQITTGLSFLHREGIFHRDFHSGNILIDQNGSPMITGFGLSRAEPTSHLERDAHAFGTVAYMAPELLCDPSSAYDNHCDVYSLGVIFWEISAGRVPFSERNDALLASDVQAGVREKVIDGTPQGYKELYQACWGVEPEKRPDVREIKRILDELVELVGDPVKIEERIDTIGVTKEGERASVPDHEGIVATRTESGNDEGEQAGEMAITAEVEKVQTDFEDWLYKYLCDAHCHPHDDVDNLDAIARLRVAHVTIMGVREADWEVVKRVVEICQNAEARDEREEAGVVRVGKAVPCFGVHPWYVHMVCSSSEPQPSDTDYTHDARYSSILTSKTSDDVAALIPTLPSPTPFTTWSAQLHENLLSYPYALVGEVGLDRSARLLPPGAEHWAGVIPTSVQCTQEHQLKILDAQLQMAWEMGRAASVHCVQAYGGLLELLKAKAKEWSPGKQVGRKKRGGKAKKNQDDNNDQSSLQDASSSALPPPPPAPHPPLRLCVHSYGGSVDMIHSLVSLPRAAVAPYFSFSVVINGRLGTRFEELVRAVPEERLLIESDLNKPNKIDLLMRIVCERVAVARGWSCEEVARRTGENWAEFVTGRGINEGEGDEEGR